MAVVSVVASPRRDGFGARIASKVEEGIRSAGKDVVRFDLNDMKVVRQCQNCEACKKNSGICVIRDDISPVIDAVRDAEGLVFTLPIAFNEMNGLFKVFHDRMYCFLDINAVTIMPKGKKLAVVVTAGMDQDRAEKVSAAIEKVMAEHFFCVPVGRIAYTTWMMSPDDPVDQDVLQQAFDIGAKF